MGKVTHLVFFCRLCRLHHTGLGEISWISKPCINMNEQCFGRHEQSGIHQDNLQIDAVGDSLDKHARRVIRPNLENLRKQLRTVEYIVKNKVPLCQYEELMNLQIQNGAFTDSVGVFSSRKICREMLQCLATAARGQQRA